MKKTICELFAGVGGFRLGFEKQSKKWETVWFSQWEPGKTKQWAHDCYVNHWGDIDSNTGIDIALVDKKKIPAHNLLVGGFPCQDYSVARPASGADGIEGKKGVLWWQIRDTIIAKKPPFCLFENVDRLLKSPAKQRGRDFGIILYCLYELGYDVEWRVINAADYGCAQRRRRTFIFAYRSNTNYYKKQSKISSEQVIKKSGFFASQFKIEQDCKILDTEFSEDDIIKISKCFQFNFKNSGYMHKNKIYTSEVTPLFEKPIVLKQIIEKKVDKKYYITKNMDKWKYLKGAKKIPKVTSTGFEYIYSEGPVGFPDKLDMPARTMLTSESTVNRSSHAIKDPETNKIRIITPIEAERIQGFDDNWTNTGMPEKFRYFCMGNALVVPLITRMAKGFDKIFKDEK